MQVSAVLWWKTNNINRRRKRQEAVKLSKLATNTVYLVQLPRVVFTIIFALKRIFFNYSGYLCHFVEPKTAGECDKTECFYIFI